MVEMGIEVHFGTEFERQFMRAGQYLDGLRRELDAAERPLTFCGFGSRLYFAFYLHDPLRS